jgi:hypothetical protein
MRRLGLLAPACLGLLVSACVKDNPAFDDCETDPSCGDETRGDGDGDSGDGDPGDGDPGDGDPGDGDPGDGDGDTGDGDGDSGDGDGDGDPALLPTCPEAMWVSMPILQDTFLDGSGFDGSGCIIDWNFETSQPVFGNGLCPGLDFGASPGHWACGEGSCNSTWLGKFDLSEWMQLPVQVQEAGFAFTARYKGAEPNVASAYDFLFGMNNVTFGDCLEWHQGQGQGGPPSQCATTFAHSAFPHLWQAPPNDQVLQAVPIAAAPILPVGDEYVEHPFVMPVDKALVQAWLSGQTMHSGILVSSGASDPWEFYLYAQGSAQPPELQAKLCFLP